MINPSAPPSIQLLNPPTHGTPVKVGNTFDGVDNHFHIVALLAGVPSSVVAEAYVRPANGNEFSIGVLCRVSGATDVFERYWKIPADFPTGAGATMTVRVFDGGTELAQDKVPVEIAPTAETVGLKWPKTNGNLGFYKDRAGAWRTTVQGVASSGVTAVDLFYSVSQPGTEVTFQKCTNGAADVKTVPNPTGVAAATDPKTFLASCQLKAGENPSDVTSIAAEATGASTDASRVHPFVQQPSQLKVSIEGVEPASPAVGYPTGLRRVAGAGCLAFDAVVRDEFGQPVHGVNVDVQASGPNDQVAFGSSEAVKAPDVSPEAKEQAAACGAAAAGEQGHQIIPGADDIKHIESTQGTDKTGSLRFSLSSETPGYSELTAWVDDEDLSTIADERPPDDDLLEDAEARGKAQATWMSGDLKIRISPTSDAAPITTCHRYTVSVLGGEIPLPNFNVDVHARVPNNKLQLCKLGGGSDLEPPEHNHNTGNFHKDGTTECADAGFACMHVEGVTDDNGQMVIGITSGTVGTTTLRVWPDGEPYLNDDLVPTGFGQPLAVAVTNWIANPDEVTIKMLTPAISAPDTQSWISVSQYRVVARVDAPYLVEAVDVYLKRSGSYTPLGEAKQVGGSDAYEFIWDLNVPLPDPGAAPTATPTPTDSGSPSPKPSRSRKSPQPKQSPTENEETASPTPVATAPSVSPTAPSTPTPPPSSATGVPDGEYRLLAVVRGTGKIAAATVEVNRVLNPVGEDVKSPYQWAQITTPLNGAAVGFADGTSTLVTGTASAGTGGVHIAYTKNAVRDSAQSMWKECGFADTSAGFAAVKSWEAICTLQAGDKGSEVTALRAYAFVCKANAADCADPQGTKVGSGTTTTTVPRSGDAAAGDAIRVQGCDTTPCLALVSQWQSSVGGCQRFVASLGDETGVPITNGEITVAVSGPGDEVRFCDEIAEPGYRRAPADGGAVGADERYSTTADPYGPDIRKSIGLTDARGQFVFGIRSDESDFESIYSTEEQGFTSMVAWLDYNGDALLNEGEQRTRSSMHWLLPDRCTIIGTPDADVLEGTDGNDKICGLGGNDVIYGGYGQDLVLGGAGDDEMYGEEEADLLMGEAGNDRLYGGPADDVVSGGQGNDQIDPGGGKNQIDGGRGKNTCQLKKKSKDKVKRCSTTTPKKAAEPA